MKHRYFIEISYKGTAYHGWQVQPNALSVQEVLNNCLSKLLSVEIYVIGAGRTDTGVHAKQLFAHFDLDDLIVDVPSFIGRLNAFLPKDIAVISLRKVQLDAHARFDATSRTYHYLVIQQKNPFNEEGAYQFHKKLDVAKMNEAARCLFNFNDFSSFSKSDTQTKTNNCNIMQAQWEKEKELLVFTIQADRFLRNMVRAIVGTLIDVGIGKISQQDFVNIILSKNRSNAGASVPSKGLYLVQVDYPKNIWNE
jgi:tRNA pseudouridine38-40 synthase